MSLITDSSQLNALCLRFSEQEFITVDTEFLRENTFWPKLCLVQLADQNQAVAIDALTPDLDLSPLLALMLNDNVVKVFHAGRQDLEILWRLSGKVPQRIFDTQVGAAVCGFGDQVSYSELVQTICGVSIDKSSRFTDWSRRPLSRAQIDYAIADVTHLRDIYLYLKQRLTAANRGYWLEDEIAALINPATYEQNPANAWERFRNRIRKPRDLAIIMELAAWREREAQSRNIPRSRVLKDDMLVEIALAAPKNSVALGALRAIPNGLERTPSGGEILAAVTRGLERDFKTLPKLNYEFRAHTNGGATVELLKVLLRHVSEAQNIAARMIATTDDLEALAKSDVPSIPALEGWRNEIFGKTALQLKNGKLALSLESGKITLVAL